MLRGGPVKNQIAIEIIVKNNNNIKNYSRNTVKENGTWQFASYHFWCHWDSAHSSAHRRESEWQPLPDGREGTSAPSSYTLIMSALLPWDFSSAEDKLSMGKKKYLLCHWNTSFPSHILEKKCWQRIPCRCRCFWTSCVWGNVGWGSNWPDACHMISEKELLWRILSITLEGDGSRRLQPRVTAVFSFWTVHFLLQSVSVLTWLQFKSLLLCQKSKHYPSILLFLFPFDLPSSAPSWVHSKCRCLKKKKKKKEPLNPLAGMKQRL